MSQVRASTPTLVALAAGSLLLYAVAERSLTPVHAEAYVKKLRAVRIMQRAEHTLAAWKMSRGIAIDERNDPSTTGVIGPQFTLTTTDRGSQAAKVVAAHPNFAAAVTQMMLQAGVREGDLVAVGLTGSLPGLNLAVLSACRAIGAEPVVIASVGASMFGATDPDFTWLDMESALDARDVWHYRSLAASLGGGGDVGRGLSPAGRRLLLDSIDRNRAQLIDAPNLMDAVRRRVALYDSVAAARGRPIKLYVNVGGGLASLGGAQNARLVPAGLTFRLAARNYPNRGVLNVMAERRVPVIHLLEVERLAARLGIVDRDTGATPDAGKGLLFVQYRYNLWVVALAAASILAANVFVLRLDLRRRLMGQPHPERADAP
ncbi:MAG TPA: poly-gamma-glutamate system protein [Candidatus Eisenbacteria bacterium]|nr:poly-gamma-glutamate system protein [Candidatus Eisenbacteria bacterium]